MQTLSTPIILFVEIFSSIIGCQAQDCAWADAFETTYTDTQTLD